jgi:hypothetical protein
MSVIDPSVNVPVALNCCVSPSGTDGIAGVTTMLTSTAAVTLSVVDPEIEFNVAVICTEPTAAVPDSPEALMVAVDVLAELHVTWVDRSCVLPSVYAPVATNC